VNSLLSLMDLSLELCAPDHTTLSRRGGRLDIPLQVHRSNEPMHLFVDSTGLKIFEQREWADAKHDGRGRQGWRKLHLGVYETGVIVAVALTDSSTGDGSVVPNLLDQIGSQTGRFTADASLGRWLVYGAATARGTTVVIPPSKTAVVSGGVGDAAKSRDKTVARIHEVGRRQWKKESGHHRQARVENTFVRYKHILAGALRARNSRGQGVEAVCPVKS